MDLRSENAFWLLKNGLTQAYPSLKTDLETEVAIIGAGITGALVGYILMKAGVKVALFDRRHAGMGSTSVSTALLQYEIDTHLTDLTNLIGEKKAVRSYQLCLEAIEQLKKLATEVGVGEEVQLRKSLYLASHKKDVKPLERECELRQQQGIAVEWLDRKEVERLFPFSAPAALLSEVGGQTDAYRLSHALLEAIVEGGGAVYNQTHLTDMTYGNEEVNLRTDNQHTVRARRVVIAAGYESLNFVQQKIATLHSTYVIISEPMSQPDLWYDNCLIWETARPYLYMRTTADNRILVGGFDEPFYNPDKRDRLLPKKTAQLEKAFAKKFPDLAFQADFSWAGTFAETPDGLPYIGSTPEHPLAYFALGFGGNGITFSLIAAHIIRDLYLDKPNSDADIFSFDRPSVKTGWFSGVLS